MIVSGREVHNDDSAGQLILSELIEMMPYILVSNVVK